VRRAFFIIGARRWITRDGLLLLAGAGAGEEIRKDREWICSVAVDARRREIRKGESLVTSAATREAA
jgi:hypothetical protein